MLQKANQIEISHLTYENKEKFGCTYDQRSLINRLVYKCEIPIQNLRLDKIGLDMTFKLDNINASKLIECLLSKSDFELIEYGTPEWIQAKTQEQLQKLIGSPRPDIKMN